MAGRIQLFNVRRTWNTIPAISGQRVRFLSANLPGADAEKFCEQAIKDKRTIYSNWVTSDEEVLRLAKTNFPEEVESFSLLTNHEPPKRKAVKICRYKGPTLKTTGGPTRVLYAGGPGPMVGAVINAVRAREKGDNEEVTFLARDTADSNFIGSGYNYHEHIATCINEDYRFRGHSLMEGLFSRRFGPTEKSIEDARTPGYRSVDISLKDLFNAHFYDNIKLMVKEELRLFSNMFHMRGNHFERTDWYHDRKYAIGTKDVLRVIDKWVEKYLPEDQSCGILLPGLKSAEADLSRNYDTSWSLATHPPQACELETLYQNVNKILDIPYSRVPASLIEGVFGDKSPLIHTAFHHPNGSRVATDFHHTYRKLVEAVGHNWTYGQEIQKIFVDNEGVVGIETLDKKGHTEFKPVDKLILSLGYSARLEYDTFDTPLLRKLFGSKNATDHIITAPGVSGYILLKGRIPTLECHISHITPIAYSEKDDVSLVKVTVGGNIASRGVPGTYLLHIMALCRRLFGDRIQGVVSFKPCPRSINFRNFTLFYRLAPNFITSEGHGGTGMTTQGTSGAISYLLTHPDVSSNELFEEIPDFLNNVDFERRYFDRTKRTRAFLGLKPTALEGAMQVA